MNKILKRSNLRKLFLSVIVICIYAFTLQAQGGHTVTGTVSDASGAMQGVNILIKGTSVGIVSGGGGKYSIEVPNDNAVLEFSLLGYSTQEILVGSRTVINVIMEEAAQEMEEIVVTALGMKREERALGYVTQKISGEKFEKVKGVNVATSLTGQIAGLQIKNSTEFLEYPNMSLRGSVALLVIDGVPYSNLGLSDLNQDNIESINVLKGASASALYGQRGAGGAIMVTTKKGGKKGFTLDVNSSNMFYAGELALPGNQTSYSSGSGGVYDHYDYVWGDKLDIGRLAEQWDPIAKGSCIKSVETIMKVRQYD